MIIRRLRSAAWAGALILAVTSISCDVLNPALIGQLGGNAGNVGPAPSGSIVIILNNQTSQQVAVDYDIESTKAGSATVTQSGSLSTGPGYWTATRDCDTTAVVLTGVSVIDASGNVTTLPLAVNEFRRPALQCGSVIFVNVPLLGSPTADLLP